MAVRQASQKTNQRTTGKPIMTKTYNVESPDILEAIKGEGDYNLKKMNKDLGVAVQVRGSRVTVSARDKVAMDKACDVLNQIRQQAKRGNDVSPEELDQILYGPLVAGEKRSASVRDKLVAKTPTQQSYLGAIAENELVFGIGPAGTGKTYLAVGAALKAFEEGSIKKIVLTRPVVEAGENLGFLPGGMSEKIDPYLRPLYDAIEDFVGTERLERMKRLGQIEVAPLAYMRGRTLTGCFLILDEAQNCSPKQVVMLLTRLGQGSRCIVTGDMRQSDIRGMSGLEYAVRALARTDGIETVEFDSTDVIRSPLVAKLIGAFDKFESEKPQ